MITTDQMHRARGRFDSLHDLHLATFRANRELALQYRCLGRGNKMAARLRALGRHTEAAALQRDRMRTVRRAQQHAADTLVQSRSDVGRKWTGHRARLFTTAGGC